AAPRYGVAFVERDKRLLARDGSGSGERGKIAGLAGTLRGCRNLAESDGAASAFAFAVAAESCVRLNSLARMKAPVLERDRPAFADDRRSFRGCGDGEISADTPLS